MHIDTKYQSVLEDIISRRARVAQQSAQLKDDIKAVAVELDLKPAALSKVIGLIEKEREKGGVLKIEQGILSVAAELLGSDAS
jgi:uncharacterized protein (UPF0335 family)